MAVSTQKRSWLSELRESDNGLGGWNPDASTSERPTGDFSEVLNMRKMRAGELEVRSGFRQWTAGASLTGGSGYKFPLARAEYRIDNTFVDVTFFREDGYLFALILHPGSAPSSLIPSSGCQVVGICQCEPVPVDLTQPLSEYASKVKVCATQFQTYLIVSVIAPDLTDPADQGTYALYPTDATCTTWAKISLGKQVSPTPTGFTFAQQVEGVLYAYVPDGIEREQGSGSLNDHHLRSLLRTKTDAVTGEPMLLSLDIKAPYFLSGTQSPPSPALKLWTFGKTDPPPFETIDSTAHTKSRGWNYRAVLKRKLTDSRAQTHIFSEAPSADFYIEERTYSPPVVMFADGHLPMMVDIKTLPVTASQVPMAIGDPPLISNNVVPTTIQDPGTPWPSQADWFSLRKKFSDASLQTKDENSPLYFVSAWLALADIGVTHFNARVFTPGGSPYKRDVGSWLVNNSPNVIFTWANFGLDPTTDTELYQIDIYRTPYSFPDEKQNATRDPLWGNPYNYGYVGTLHSKDISFTDNIPDTGLIFEENILEAEGYLEGEFAGEVMRPYQNHYVLGNTYTKAHVRSPWPGVQAFAYPVSGSAGTDVGYDRDNLVSSGGPIINWYYYYIDRDGNKSDASPITLDTTQVNPMLANDVGFVFPRGFSDRIVAAVLIRGTLSGGTRTYAIEATVPLAPGFYASKNPSLSAMSPQPSLTDGLLQTGNTQFSHDPGYIIWSDPENPWSWPQENIENEHDQNPVTSLDEVIGPLYVSSDRGIVMSRLTGYREPVNTSNTGAGCISRFASVKIDKVLFLLSAAGLTVVGGSGVKSFPADIDTEIKKRLREQIPGLPSLAGVRDRVSMGYLPNRSELWITFPSTIELGGLLPARTFVIKFLEDKTFAYEFEIAGGLVPNSDPLLAYDNPVGRVLHLTHADGSMFSAFFLPPDQDNPPRMVIQDNDVPEIPWPGDWAFQYDSAIGTPNVTKHLLQINFLASQHTKFYLTTGMLRQDNYYDRVLGTINTQSTPREIAPLNNNGQVSEYHLPISGSLSETSGCPPAFRFYGKPNEWFENDFTIQNFDLYFGFDHAHKGA